MTKSETVIPKCLEIENLYAKKKKKKNPNCQWFKSDF